MLGTYLEQVREKGPLVHCITNYVTVNDVANILLACGGSPIMSDEIQDVEDITSLCGGLVINIGTLDQRTIPAMFAAGKRANALGGAGSGCDPGEHLRDQDPGRRLGHHPGGGRRCG